MATDGFALIKIQNPLPQESEFATLLPSDSELDHLKSILSQPFHYLNCGGQSYVFESEDHAYVIKFFKFHHMRIPPWLNHIPLIPSLQSYKEKKLAKKDGVLKRTFRSYKVAEKQFVEESALVFLHLSETDIFKEDLEIINKIGMHFKLPIDKMAFAIQRKGVLAYKRISELMESGEIDHAKLLITKMINLSLHRCLKGVRDEDANFKKNFGFIQDEPLQLDLGRLVIDEEEKNPKVFIPEIRRITKDFREWLAITYPQLVSQLDHELSQLESYYSL